MVPLWDFEVVRPTFSPKDFALNAMVVNIMHYAPLHPPDRDLYVQYTRETSIDDLKSTHM